MSQFAARPCSRWCAVAPPAASKNPSGVGVTHMNAMSRGSSRHRHGVAGPGDGRRQDVGSILSIPQIANAATPPPSCWIPWITRRGSRLTRNLPDAHPGATELEGARQDHVPGAEPNWQRWSRSATASARAASLRVPTPPFRSSRARITSSPARCKGCPRAPRQARATISV